jgi:hypothetical protein
MHDCADKRKDARARFEYGGVYMLASNVVTMLMQRNAGRQMTCTEHAVIPHKAQRGIQNM